jgi:uncharacterized protein with HEPN domain|tara:strand:- start:997 stop:1341 length:345 start_codon:yes stop_codon:yes gene_type:complete
MLHDEKMVLFDIFQGCNIIQSFIQNETLDSYQSDLKLRLAIEREFEIIGEALNRLSTINETLFDKITESRRIIGLRNQIAHGYDSVDHSILWHIATTKLSTLSAEVQKLLSDFS